MNKKDEANKMASKSTQKYTRRRIKPNSEKIPSNILLLDAIVRVVAKQGIENTSTRAVAAEAGNGITDTVIYRFFSGKENLLLRAFCRESVTFMQEVDSLFSVLWEKKLPGEQRMRFLWHTVWTWQTNHKAACTFMTRYYYSAYFDKRAEAKYREIWLPLAERLHDLLPNTDTEALTFMTLEATAAACYPVCCGRQPDCASASEYGFRRVMGLVNGFIEGDSLPKSNRS